MPSRLSREKCAEHKKSELVTEPPCAALNGRRWVGAVAIKTRHRVAIQGEISRIIAPLTMTAFQDISHSLRQLYLEDERPWLVGFSGDERMEKLIEFRELLCGALECGSLLPLFPRQLARGNPFPSPRPASWPVRKRQQAAALQIEGILCAIGLTARFTAWN